MNEDSVFFVFADLIDRKMIKKELLKKLEELCLAGCRDTQKKKNTSSS
jgi:hypothetical protein